MYYSEPEKPIRLAIFYDIGETFSLAIRLCLILVAVYLSGADALIFNQAE
jgi:hypothetical protein